MSREREGKNQLDKVLGLAGAQLPDALDLKTETWQYRKTHPVTLSGAKRPGDDDAHRDASLRSA